MVNKNLPLAEFFVYIIDCLRLGVFAVGVC